MSIITFALWFTFTAAMINCCCSLRIHSPYAVRKHILRSRLYADISSSSIKELREKCGAGFLDCKRALIECSGDIKNSIDYLRKQGVILAAKKGHRVTSTGLIGSAVSADGVRGYLVEVNTETDFVVKNEIFVNLVSTIARGLANSSPDAVRNVSDIANLMIDGQQVKDLVVEAIAKTGEFISIQRMVSVKVPFPGLVASYTHGAGFDSLGKIGVLVGIHCEDTISDTIKRFGRHVGMHIAAQSPEALQISDIDPESLQRERDIILHQIQQQGKPSPFIDKQIEGKLRKYYEQVALLEQKLDMNPKTTVKEFVVETAKTIGHDIQLVGFKRLAIGELSP